MPVSQLLVITEAYYKMTYILSPNGYLSKWQNQKLKYENPQKFFSRWWKMAEYIFRSKEMFPLNLNVWHKYFCLLQALPHHTAVHIVSNHSSVDMMLLSYFWMSSLLCETHHFSVSLCKNTSTCEKSIHSTLSATPSYLMRHFKIHTGDNLMQWTFLISSSQSLHLGKYKTQVLGKEI